MVSMAPKKKEVGYVTHDMSIQIPCKCFICQLFNVVNILNNTSCVYWLYLADFSEERCSYFRYCVGPDSGLVRCQIVRWSRSCSIERANLVTYLIIHKLLRRIVFLQQTKELDNVGILFITVQLAIPRNKVSLRPCRTCEDTTRWLSLKYYKRAWGAGGLRTGRLYRQNIQPEYDKDDRLVYLLE